MTRVKRYIESDVYSEAKRRIHHIYDLFDNVVVMFSGGKDSLAALHLTWEVARERGLTHVDAVFRDEELIQDEVIDFVNEYRQLPWLRLLWFCVPLKSHMYVLGQTSEYVQWDPNRRHLRPKPAWAITDDTMVYDQYTMDATVARYYKGKIAFITGIRSGESLTRWRSSVNKLNENYINASGSANVNLCKPIFDWEENDLFKYFYDNGIKYCSLYNDQLWCNHSFRVATPLHAEAAKRFHMLRAMSPYFYAQVIDLFPAMLVQERYYRDLDRESVIRRYGNSLDGVRSWVLEHIDDEDQQRLALLRLEKVRIRENNSPGSYPPDHVLKGFMSGAYKREIQPIGMDEKRKRVARRAKEATRLQEG